MQILPVDMFTPSWFRLSSQSTLPSEKGTENLAGVDILIGTLILYARTRTGAAALQHKDRV
jgi:hypothetical protein